MITKINNFYLFLLSILHKRMFFHFINPNSFFRVWI